MCGFDDENTPCRNTARHGIYVVPYSDHSNYEELFTFISHLKPTELYPIVNETKIPSKKILHCRLIRTLHTHTESLNQLCREKRQESTNYQNKELVVSCDTKEYKVLPAPLCCDIRHTKSQHRPRIIQRKKLSRIFQKKGVQFESSFTSDDGDETLKTDVKHTTKLETKDNCSDVQVKLFDRYSVHGYCRERPSENWGDASSYTMPSHSSGGRISPSKNIDTESEGFDRCSPSYNSNTINAQGNPSDADHISFNSLSDVTKPRTKSLDGTVESEQEFEDEVWSDSISVKEERVQELDIKSDGEVGDLSRHRTEDTVKNPMVFIPTHSNVAQRLLESSELYNAKEETQIHVQWTCPSSLRKRGWNKHPRFHSCSRDSGIFVSAKQKCMSLNIQRLRLPWFPCDINATHVCKAYGIQYQATQIASCESNFNKASGDRIQISSVKSLQTSNWTSAENMLQSDTGSLLQFSPAPTLLTCSDAQCHKASDDRIQITSVTSLQTSDWSREPDLLQSDTGNLLQFSPLPTLLTCSDAQSHDIGNQAVTGYHTNSKKSKHIALVTEENKVTSRLNTRDRITSNKETRTTSESCSRSFEEPDNSIVSQIEQSLNHCPLSSHVLQTEGLCSVAVQCEEMLLSQNAARITPSFQQMEVVTPESDGMRSGQSDKSEERIVARRKLISSENQLSNISVVGSKRKSECSSPETSIVMTNSANVGGSYSPKKRCYHKCDGQKNKVTLRSDCILQNNYNINTGGQSMDQNEATVFADKSSEHRKHTKAVSSTTYNSKEYNRTPADECEAFVRPGMPLSAYQKDCNYWTNRDPFSMYEVRQAAKHLHVQRSDSKEYNRTPADECEVFIRPGMPLSAYKKGCNYWTNRDPFAMYEIRQAAKHLRFQRSDSKEYNKTPADECEVFVRPGMPLSAYQKDCNYWTNRDPFAMYEVRQAAKHLPFQSSNIPIHNVINYPSGIIMHEKPLVPCAEDKNGQKN